MVIVARGSRGLSSLEPGRLVGADQSPVHGVPISVPAIDLATARCAARWHVMSRLMAFVTTAARTMRIALVVSPEAQGRRPARDLSNRRFSLDAGANASRAHRQPLISQAGDHFHCRSGSRVAPPEARRRSAEQPAFAPLRHPRRICGRTDADLARVAAISPRAGARSARHDRRSRSARRPGFAPPSCRHSTDPSRECAL